ncbi:protein Mis18-beta [Petaurus breviceps papuanus]|uniref:protein Mis18-beta n=1 Tax=Petaurus breviceps papuanus TaxID=3040969 RepID=UPI0036DF6145
MLGSLAPSLTMRRFSRRKRGPGAGANAEEQKATSPRRSDKKTLSEIFQELEKEAIKESLQREEPAERDRKAAKRFYCQGRSWLLGDEAAPQPGKSEPQDNFLLFHCLDCFAVLGDSVHLCGEETPLLSVLVLSRITNNVFLDKSLLVGTKGALRGSTYYPLFCHSCGLSVGFRLYSTYATFSDLKDLYCLFKNSIVCYFLKTKSIVKASEVEFPTKSLNAQISKLEEKIMMMDSKLTAIIEDLKRIKGHGPRDVELD